MAVLKAQLSLVENREEAARVRIMVLERQCQNMDGDLERLKDEMAYMNPPKEEKRSSNKVPNLKTQIGGFARKTDRGPRRK